jgi:hypothetical protein
MQAFVTLEPLPPDLSRDIEGRARCVKILELAGSSPTNGTKFSRHSLSGWQRTCLIGLRRAVVLAVR